MWRKSTRDVYKTWLYVLSTTDSRQESQKGVYKTWARPWPTLCPTQNFAVFTKIARSGKFSQNLVKRGMEPAEDCRHHETGYCATVKCDAFRQWLQWAKKQDYLYLTLGNNDPWH